MLNPPLPCHTQLFPGSAPSHQMAGVLSPHSCSPTAHVHHVADLVVAQRQHLQLDEGIQRVNLGNPVAGQAQVLQICQCVQPLDGLNVVEG